MLLHISSLSKAIQGNSQRGKLFVRAKLGFHLYLSLPIIFQPEHWVDAVFFGEKESISEAELLITI